MSKFNAPSKSSRVINKAGGESFELTPKVRLITHLLTSFVQDQYYRSESEGIKELQGLIGIIPDKKFIAKTAIYARNEFGMRSVSHIAAGELAKIVKGEKWTKNFYSKVVRRVDDVTEILSYYINAYNKPIPNSLKKGLGLALNKFNGYQLAKYRGEGKELSLVDVFNLIHPVPSEKNKQVFKDLIDGKLKSTETWESKISATKGDDEAKAGAWRDLIKEKKIGYFALLKNLRNILEQAPDMVPQALAMLTDEKLIKGSLVLPFRFLTAIEEIEQLNGRGVREILGGLALAIDKATSNVPHMDGDTLIAVDMSGSMEGRIKNIANLFAAILYKANNADIIMFSNDAEYCSPNPSDSTLTIANRLPFTGGGTNFHAIFETANKAYDRIVILSDMQGWVGYDAPTSTYAKYKKRTGAEPTIFSVDLQGYGTIQFPENSVFCLAGFSEKIFDVMKLLEQDRHALIAEIEKIEL